MLQCKSKQHNFPEFVSTLIGKLYTGTGLKDV